MEIKSQIRAEIKQRRKSLGKLKKILLARKIRIRLEKFELFIKAKCILLYASMPDEISTFKLIKKHNKSKKILLPTVCTDTKTLKLYHLENLNELKPGYQGILEIPHCLKQSENPEKIDLCIVPGLAFDMEGGRIGYGKGFYDTLLQNIKAPKIALAYDFSVYEKVPTSQYDIPVDYIITESQTISTSRL